MGEAKRRAKNRDDRVNMAIARQIKEFEESKEQQRKQEEIEKIRFQNLSPEEQQKELEIKQEQKNRMKEFNQIISYFNDTLYHLYDLR